MITIQNSLPAFGAIMYSVFLLVVLENLTGASAAEEEKPKQSQETVRNNTDDRYVDCCNGLMLSIIKHYI